MTDAGKVMITPKGEYDASVTYEKYDNVSYSGVLYIALKTVTGIEPTDDGTNWMKWIDLGSVDVNSLSPTFTEATDRVNVMSGETIPTLFGKIKKWFTDLKEIAFSGSYNDLSDTPTIPAAVSVKGNNETAYRTGEVNLTAEDIGAVATDGDTAENTVAFTSADSTTANAWTDVSALATGEKHSSILNKVSTMFKNIRFLYKMLGTTDISAIGDGTVTNALSTLNSNLNAADNSFIDTSTTTIEDMKRFIINCAKSGKMNIRIHNQHSPNLIFGKQGNFLITMNNDGNNVSCLAINHWSATPILFSFSIDTELDNWHFVDLNIIDYTSQISKNNDVISGMYSTNIRKVGHIATFAIDITVKAVSSSDVVLGTLPEGVRPIADISFNALTNNGDACYVYINSNGEFGIRKIIATEFAENDGVRLCATYIIKE